MRRLRVGQRVEAVTGAIAVGRAARARCAGRDGRHRVEQARQLVEGIALGVADGGDGVEAARREHPGPPRRMDGPRRRRDDREAALATGLDEHLDPVSGLRGHLLGRRGPRREHGVGPRPGHVHLPVDATAWGPLLVAGPDALDEGSEPGRDGGVDEGLEQTLRDRAALELEHLETARDGPTDQADAGPRAIPAVELGEGGTRQHVSLPGTDRRLRAVLLGRHDAEARGVGGERRLTDAWAPVVHAGRGACPGSRATLPGPRWPRRRRGRPVAPGRPVRCARRAAARR